MDSVDHKIGDWIFKDTQIMFDTCGEVLIPSYDQHIGLYCMWSLHYPHANTSR